MSKSTRIYGESRALTVNPCRFGLRRKCSRFQGGSGTLREACILHDRRTDGRTDTNQQGATAPCCADANEAEETLVESPSTSTLYY